jgi:hypothetical protein
MTRQTSVIAVVAIAALYGCSFRALSPREVEEWRAVSKSEPMEYQHEAVCSLHHIPTQEMAVPGYGGMSIRPPSAYVRARIRSFPNSWLYVNTGFCMQTGVEPVVRWFCPLCRKAELRWRRFHGYDLPDQISAETGEWITVPLK